MIGSDGLKQAYVDDCIVFVFVFMVFQKAQTQNRDFSFFLSFFYFNHELEGSEC